jgi:O-acetyl-ADP-ribose deacetylase (regulator of RNase III)
MSARLEVIVGRIERQCCDAVVNAANQRLLPGTGVDGAIRQAAGPELTACTAQLQPIAQGAAIITPGFKLKAKWIVHTAAPVWYACEEEAEKLWGLSACYRNALLLAQEKALTSIAFPCLGTGNYAWPKELACDIAVRTCKQTLADAPALKKIVFCCFAEDEAKIYRARLKQT